MTWKTLRRTLSRYWLYARVGVAAIGLLVATVLGYRWYRDVVQFKANKTRYTLLALQAAQRHQIDPCLVLGVIQRESAFRAGAVGDAGEVGLMQITEGAAKDWERVTGQRYVNRSRMFTPELNIEIGVWYLSQGYQIWQSREDAVVLTLAQYNAGPSRAREWAKLDEKNIHDMIPIASTKTYITKVIEYRNQFRESGLCRAN